MVLAHDWGTVGDFEEFEPQDAERLSNPTWRNMLSFFGKAGVDPKDCFYTNFFVGLRTGKSSVGKFPGAKDVDYVKRCQDFFVEQVEKQKPRLILALGAYVPKLISSTSDDLGDWKKFESFKKLDQNQFASFRDVKLRGSDHSFSIASLVHPCYRQRNAQIRAWNGFLGDEAEVNLIRHMLAFKT